MEAHLGAADEEAGLPVCAVQDSTVDAEIQAESVSGQGGRRGQRGQEEDETGEAGGGLP